MSEVIVDTSALIAFFIQSEKHHKSAQQYVKQNPTLRWVILETVFDEFVTWDNFCQYDDKNWSYTDCSILVMARKLNVAQIFAFDDHIRQMAGLGVRCVP